MECNRDEALRAKEIAEQKFTSTDVAGAKKFALKAHNLYPSLDGISQMIATLDVHLSAEANINGERDWYSILGVDILADDEQVKKQYRKLALILHPDKNKSVGAETAFKLVSEAWSVLSDKTRRMSYDHKRNVKVSQQRPQQSHTSSNGFHSFTKNSSSNLRSQKQSARMAPTSASRPPCPPKLNTFWTSCNRCKMQYEYLRIYLNHNLLCPNCHEPFLAVETGNPINGHNPSVPWSSSQRQHFSSHNRSSHNHGRKSSTIPGTASVGFQHGSHINPNNQPGLFSSTDGDAQAANLGNQTYDKFTGETFVQKGVQVPKRSASGSDFTFSSTAADQHGSVLSSVDKPGKKRRGNNEDGISDHGGSESEGNAGIGRGTGFFKERFSSISGPRVACGQSNFLISSFNIRNMLMQKAKTLVQSKLEEWTAASTAKSDQKDVKQKQRQKRKENDKEMKSPVEDGSEDIKPEKRGVTKQSTNEKASSAEAAVDSNKVIKEHVSIDVPDPDFHDFDKDRAERCFEPDQVWVTYDDEDGMPRFYALIQKVISLKPFKLRMTFLNSKTNSELGPLNWVAMGFAKTCGEFRVSRYETNDSINIFSHKVKWEKGARGAVRIFPCKGDTWALYRNWSPEWNEHTPDDVIYKYDMVQILDDYNEDQGVTVTPLVKVAGFKTVFHRHLDPKKVKRIPREEMFRFSHQVPSWLLTGTESPNVPKGCLELDPAATPVELLQVITEAKEEESMENSEQKAVA